jgi:hypothetical protein
MDGAPGKDGTNGTDNGFAYVLSCSGTVDADLRPHWDGMALSYQKAETSAGDVYVSGYTGGKGGNNESATAFYKKGIEGAEKGGLTIGAGDGYYLYITSMHGPVAGVLVVEGRGPEEFSQVIDCMKY